MLRRQKHVLSQSTTPFACTLFKTSTVGNGPTTVSESTVSKTELSEFFLPSPSSGERAQWVPLSLRFVWQSELTEFFAELTEFAPKLGEAQWVLFSETVLSKQYFARFLSRAPRPTESQNPPATKEIPKTPKSLRIPYNKPYSLKVNRISAKVHVIFPKVHVKYF